MRGPEYLNSGIKRSLDLAIGYGSLPLSSPIFTVMYCYNRRRGEPLFFEQERIGQVGKRFCIFKFETLYSGAEKSDFHHKRLYLDPKQKDSEDPRTPNRGMRLIRRTGLNELPPFSIIITSPIL